MQGFDHACLCTMVFCYIEDIIPRSMSLSFEDNTLGSFPWLLVACMLLQNTSCCCIFYGLYLCWILFSIAAWYFAISFLLLKCSHSNYVLFFFSGEFSPFNSFIYASFCFLYAAGMWGQFCNTLKAISAAAKGISFPGWQHFSQEWWPFCPHQEPRN